jgi:hypothetical protein
MAVLTVKTNSTYPITGSLELHLYDDTTLVATFYREIDDFDDAPEFDVMENGVVQILRYARDVLGDQAFQVKLSTAGFVIEV